MNKPLDVLVLCTGNSCRSILAEALINQLSGGRCRAVSAGSHPTGEVHPGALATLARHGIDPGRPRSKSWEEFAGRHFDVVITVCDQAAQESCPVFSGPGRKRHWSTPDPAAVTGSDALVREAFERAYRLLRDHIEKELL